MEDQTEFLQFVRARIREVDLALTNRIQAGEAKLEDRLELPDMRLVEQAVTCCRSSA